MIHYGGIPRGSPILYCFPAPSLLGCFPALFALLLARAIRSVGSQGPVRRSILLGQLLNGQDLELTGQLWNAIGYSQAYQPMLIQPARWGGVYAVGFLILLSIAPSSFAL